MFPTDEHGAGNVVQLRDRRYHTLARDAALIYGAKASTVAKPGDLVSPDAILRSVWKGTDDSSASRCNCGGSRGASASRTSSGLGTKSFMGHHPTDIGRTSLPFPVALSEYPDDMPGSAIKAILIANVELLMKSKYGKQNVTGFGRDTGINTGGAQRVLDPKTSVGVDLLEKIAVHFKLETWQLLAPNLGQSLLLSPAELDAVRKLREPQQPKPLPPAKQQPAISQKRAVTAGADARRREA